MRDDVYDVVVLGGGAGGVPAAIRASQLGGRVAVVERDRLGGLCMNRACVPFGHMLAAANIIGSLGLGAEMGIGLPGPRLDYPVLRARQDELIKFMGQGVRTQLLKNRVEIVEGEGSITAPGKIRAGERSLTCRNIILACGTQPVIPDLPGAPPGVIITSDDLLRQERVPDRMLLFGDSPWLIGIAQVLHRYGSRVILATPDKSLLGLESKAVRTRLAKAIKDHGIRVITGAGIVELREAPAGALCLLRTKDGEERHEIDRVLVVDRRPAIEGLGIEKAGLSPDDGLIRVNDHMETGKTGIYAVGDITVPASERYSHNASTGGIVAAENSMGRRSAFNRATCPRVLFTRPQVACVGLTGKQAKKKGLDTVVGSAPLSMNTFGMITSQQEGLVEVVAEKRYGEILGIHIIGDAACEMAGQAVLALQMEATLEELAGASFPHPTLSESLAEAARDALGRPIYLP